MRRLIGWLLMLHGLAHASAGMLVGPATPVWVVTLLWWIAMTGFVAAGFGLLGFAPLERAWQPLSSVAAVSSIALIALSWHPVLMIGAAIDAVVLLANVPWLRADLMARVSAPSAHHRRTLARIGMGCAGLAIAYLSAVILFRPAAMRWGVSDEERAMRLPGDEAVADARYRLDHGVTIHAPADSVWPWLVQLGQDRAGFYSYDWLERLAGDPVHNVDSIVPAWQRLEPGDLVRATPSNYLGGIFGDSLGWRVKSIVPRRAVILEGWGAFVVQPRDDSTSRMFVRTRGEGKPSLALVPIAPLSLLVLEPAHFIMQRGMLLGIKARAERRRS